MGVAGCWGFRLFAPRRLEIVVLSGADVGRVGIGGHAPPPSARRNRLGPRRHPPQKHEDATHLSRGSAFRPGSSPNGRVVRMIHPGPTFAVEPGQVPEAEGPQDAVLGLEQVGVLQVPTQVGGATLDATRPRTLGEQPQVGGQVERVAEPLQAGKVLVVVDVARFAKPSRPIRGQVRAASCRRRRAAGSARGSAELPSVPGVAFWSSF